MNNNKYNFSYEVINDQSPSFISDVAFHPNGSIFAVTYRDNDEVRIYNPSSRELLRTYKNPESLLYLPHGIKITENHIIVSNKILSSFVEPAIFTIYRIDAQSSKPVTVFRTPLEDLGEAHSFDIHEDKLLVTYCGTKNGAVLSYHFDDETGEITGPRSILEGFTNHGEPKGICFLEEGKKIIISITSTAPYKQDHFIGLAIFDIDENAKLSKTPVQLISMPGTRIENINRTDELCAVADPLNDSVYVYHLDTDTCFKNPAQTIKDNLSFPHSACFSPDKKQLVVTNYGLEVVNKNINWGKFLTPRSDKFTVFKLSE